MNTKQIKILISNGKTELFYDNFQIINNLNMVMLGDQNLYTVLKDSKGFYIPSSGSSGNRYIEAMVMRGEEVFYVS